MNFRKNESFTPQMRSHLKTTAMRLGLVRLLMDAGRAEEARTTLASLPSLQCVEEESEPPTKVAVPNDIPILSNRLAALFVEIPTDSAGHLYITASRTDVLRAAP